MTQYYKPKIGDFVKTIGGEGLYVVADVSEDDHTVSLKQKHGDAHLGFIPWNALIRTGLREK